MRSLLVTLHPPNLRRVGLQAALADIAAPLVGAGVDVDVDVAAAGGLGPEAEALVFRVADEALRNAHQHGHPHRVEVHLRHDDGFARLFVRDDGDGFAVGELDGRRSGGHRGLALLQDLAADAGGRLSVDSAPGHGTRVRLEAPVR